MRAGLHLGRERTPLEAVAAELIRLEPSCRRTRLNDAEDRPSGEGLPPDRG